MTLSRIRVWITLLALLVIIFIARTHHRHACLITWRVGDIDPRFHITAGEVLNAADGATHLWEAAAGRQLFRYDPREGVPIKLIYDDRQATVDLDVAQRSEIDQLGAQIERMKAAFDSDPSQEAASRINSAVDRYNNLVTQYNARGGRAVQQGAFEQIVEKRGNRIIGTEARGITVYQFHDENDLELVIAHELGHALGIDHVNEPGAIMNERHSYGDLQGPLQVHGGDIAALQRVCPVAD